MTKFKVPGDGDSRQAFCQKFKAPGDGKFSTNAKPLEAGIPDSDFFKISLSGIPVSRDFGFLEKSMTGIPVPMDFELFQKIPVWNPRLQGL